MNAKKLTPTQWRKLGWEKRREYVVAEIKDLPEASIRLIASRSALRAAFYTGSRGSDFPFFSDKEKIPTHLFNHFNALNIAFLVALTPKKSYSKDKIRRIAKDSHDAADATAAAAYAADATAAAYAAADADAAAAAADAAYAYAAAAYAESLFDDISFFQKNKHQHEFKQEELPPLFSGDLPENFKEYNQNLLEGLDKQGLSYWRRAYEGWLQGKFDLLEMQRAFDMPDEIYEAGVEARIAYLEKPHQGNGGFHFILNEQTQKLEAKPHVTPASNENFARELHEAMKKKLSVLLKAPFFLQLSKASRDKLVDAEIALNSSYEQLTDGQLYSVLKFLEALAKQYDSDDGRKELTPDDIALLQDAAETMQGLCALYPNIRNLLVEIQAQKILENPDAYLKQSQALDKALIESGSLAESALKALKNAARAIGNALSSLEQAQQIGLWLLNQKNILRAIIKPLWDDWVTEKEGKAIADITKRTFAVGLALLILNTMTGLTPHGHSLTAVYGLLLWQIKKILDDLDKDDKKPPSKPKKKP